MSHMYADTSHELLDMADRIGVDRKWLQYPGRPDREHFDISLSKRALAVKAGAVEVPLRHWGQFTRCRLRVVPMTFELRPAHPPGSARPG